MSKKLDKRTYLRVSDEDKQMVKVLARKLNLKESDVWRFALKNLYNTHS